MEATFLLCNLYFMVLVTLHYNLCMEKYDITNLTIVQSIFFFNLLNIVLESSSSFPMVNTYKSVSYVWYISQPGNLGHRGDSELTDSIICVIITDFSSN